MNIKNNYDPKFEPWGIGEYEVVQLHAICEAISDGELCETHFGNWCKLYELVHYYVGRLRRNPIYVIVHIFVDNLFEDLTKIG